MATAGIAGPVNARTRGNVQPYLADVDVRLYHGDCLEVLHSLPDRSVHMCATSPPFWSLRDYGHDGQIGLEQSVDEWVARLVSVFDEVRRVLRDDATLWLELGDSFSNKQLVGQPWRLAFALQRAGWFLRSEVIWARLQTEPDARVGHGPADEVALHDLFAQQETSLLLRRGRDPRAVQRGNARAELYGEQGRELHGGEGTGRSRTRREWRREQTAERSSRW
jgi:hypothetical protein